ncbi:hypothetical protein TW65_00083 [Stemphylium lycopersici]|uniref:Ring finger domain protein n=1 Tax=Stemphylium lycopersici TaxID=183478 RepID=A0A364NB10_STELY|nr:hypothetical protein TW65_00083 [Stemphylium lycopersici]RAR14231.1 ring finger domain protein [Stemphylium lycopersici]
MDNASFGHVADVIPNGLSVILIIYCDSAAFVFATAIVVHGFGINSSPQVCEGGILLLPYTIFVIMNFIFRITYINDDGVCIIGMEKIAMLPLITFEVVVNVYLTALFIIPLRSLYSYKKNQNPSLRRMATRSLVGSLTTLTTSVVNLTILMILKGEPGWICLMCCNADILFCVLVLHWVTSKEKSGNTNAAASGETGATATIGSARGARRTSRIGDAGVVLGSTFLGTTSLDEEKKTDVRVTMSNVDSRTNSTNSTNSARGSNHNGKNTTDDNHTAPGNIHSNRSSRRPSYGLSIFPSARTSSRSPSRPHTSPRRPIHSITTECRSMSPAPGRSRAPSRGFNRIASTEDYSDEVELNNIRVETSHTVEVEVERDMERGRRRVSASESIQEGSMRSDADEWVGVERRVAGENYV